MTSKTEKKILSKCPKCRVYWTREIVGETYKNEPIFAYTFLINDGSDGLQSTVWDCPKCKPDSWINCRKDE